MPTINKERIHFEGREFVREIKVSSTGVFSIELPAEVIKAGFKSPITADTKQNALSTFQRTLKDYSATQTITTRVICYQFRATCYVMREGKCLFKQDGISFVTGTAIQLAAQVFDEHATKRTDGTTTFRYDAVKSSIPDGLRFRNGECPGREQQFRDQIPHDETTEAFFAKIGRSMEDMIMSLDSVFASKDAVKKFITSGKFPALTA